MSNFAALKEVIIQAKLGDSKAKEIIEDIKNTHSKYLLKKEVIQYIKGNESIDLLILIEKQVGKVLSEEDKTIIEEFIQGKNHIHI